MSTRTDREIKDGLTEEDAAIFHSHGLNAYRAHRQDFDSTDYRAMLARCVATHNGNRSGYFHTPAMFVEWEENIGKLWREEFEAA